MVSLRERKSRPSYASMAGLELLSEDSGSEKGHPAESSRAKGKEKEGPGYGAESSDDGDAISLSSGDSSEFQPDVDQPKEKKKGRGGPGSSRRANTAGDSSDGHSSDELKELEESEDDEMDVDEDESDLVSINESERRQKGSGRGMKNRIKGKEASRRPRPKKNQVVRAIIPSYDRPNKPGLSTQGGRPGGNGLDSLPPAYRSILQQSTVVLAKPAVRTEQQKQGTGRENEKYRNLGVEGFTSGPSTPVITRLTRHPREQPYSKELVRWVSDEHGEDTIKRKETRQVTGWKVQDYYGLESPWEMWQGEGWWKGMYEDSRASVTKQVASTAETSRKGKGKDVDAGWKFRQDVKLGLEGTGRLKTSHSDLLSESAAAEHLSQGQIVCHVGAYGSQTAQAFARFQTQKLSDQDGLRDGFIFSAGGPIWGMDWCPVPLSTPKQYLAISTLPDLDTQPLLGQKVHPQEKGSVQIWSLVPTTQASAGEDGEGQTDNGSSSQSVLRCEMVLCIKGGSATEIKWMPLGAHDEDDATGTQNGGLPKLGILACIQLDGSVSLYPVPRPETLTPSDSVYNAPIYLPLDEPLLKLEVDDATCTTCDWMTGERIAVGTSNGDGIIWDVGDALRSGKKADIMPVSYFQVALSSISTVRAVRVAPGDVQGFAQYDGDPPYVILSSYDGSVTMVDVRDPTVRVELNRQRTPSLACTWAPHLAGPLYADIDHVVQAQKVFGIGVTRATGISAHRGPILDVAASDYHTMVVSCSTDGSSLIANYFTGQHRRRKLPLLFRRLFEMDYDSHSQEYRMTDSFVPDVMTLGDAGERHTPKLIKKAETNPAFVSTALWSPHVGVHKAVWNNAGGIHNAGWLAVGTASGLGRVEWIEGRWYNNTVPAELAL